MDATTGKNLVDYQRILVTGGLGFVGGFLVKALRAHWPNAEVVIADRRGGRSAGHILLDLQDAASIRGAIETTKPDLVLHLAAEASVSSANAAAASAWRINTGATLELAAALANHSPNVTVLFTSSSEVYGRAFARGTVNEQTLPDPLTVYGQSKLAAEQVLSAVLPPEARLIVVRPSNHAGPGQDERFVIPAFASQIVRAERGGEAVISVGNLDSERDFMDVRDVAAAYVALLSSPLDPGCREVFNVASGSARTVRSLLDILRGMASRETFVEIDPERSRPSEIPRADIDIARLREKTGWMPFTAIEKTLADVLDYARRQAVG